MQGGKNSDTDKSGRKKIKEVYGEVYGGVWRRLHSALSVSDFDQILAPVANKEVFTLLLFKKILNLQCDLER